MYWCEDCEEINLWTYWQGRGNLDAKIMLVGQDWGCPWDESSQNTMKQIGLANRGEEYRYLENNPSVTDKRLIRLFQEIGYEDISNSYSDLFFTNFILGYRNKGLSGAYQQSWADHDKGYFRELANIIEPKVILCLGRSTFEGVLSAFEVALSRSLAVTGNTGLNLDTDVLLALSLGGISIAGGSATRIRSAIIGVLTYYILNNGMLLWGMNPDYVDIVKAVFFLATVSISIDRSEYDLIA